MDILRIKICMRILVGAIDGVLPRNALDICSLAVLAGTAVMITFPTSLPSTRQVFVSAQSHLRIARIHSHDTVTILDLMCVPILV